MSPKNKNKFWLFIAFLAVILFLPSSGQSQSTDIFGDDTLLKEYLFPISVPLQAEGRTQVLGAKQCFSLTDAEFTGTPTNNCQSEWNTNCLVQDVASCNNIKNEGIWSNAQYKVSYKFNLGTKGNYTLKISTSNLDDNFLVLSDDEADYLLANMPDRAAVLARLKDVPKPIGGDRALIRSIIYAVYADGLGAENLKGYIIVDNTDPANSQEGSLVIENLNTGDHEIILKSLSLIDYALSTAEVPAEFNNFANVDLNSDGRLAVKPVLYQVTLDRLVSGDDIIGVRIYSNKQNKEPLTWYRDNVINASSNVTPITVDGYRGIRDDRTVYVEAANLVELAKKCKDGTAEGSACNFNEDCPDGGRCITPKQFYTNIYVIAYNQNAAAETQNIFDQMLEKWIFNKNIVDQDPFGAEAKKDKLRRDTIRKSDARNLQILIDNYKAAHGQCPLLAAGTFVRGHSFSMWPSWQSTLANELGSGLPNDPLNIFSTKIDGPYDCQNPVNAENCKNLCTNTNLGCPANEQCVNNQYCSVCPPGYDPQTCWDNLKLEFPLAVNKDCTGDSAYLNNYFILGGDACTNNGAYVYQYAVNPDNSSDCGFLIRYEYEEADLCSPGQCTFGDKCYQPGACLAGCATDENNNFTCDPVSGNYKNLYCYLGSWVSSCGNGFVQNQCGEACDPNAPISQGESWCDANYGAQNWYNEGAIASSCNAQCQWQGFETLGYTPKPFSANPGEVSCGGYCGDNIRQAVYGEKCDQGPIPAEVARPEANGVGGITKDLQYLCSGAAQSGPLSLQAPACQQYSDYQNWGDPLTNSCSDLPDYGSSNPWVSKYEGNKILSLGGFRISYQFEVKNSGLYDFKVTTANLGYNLNNLSNDQVDYIFSLQDGTKANLYNITATGELNIPEYGQAVDKANLLRSLIYSVYIKPSSESGEGELVGYIIVPASSAAQNGSVPLGNLGQGNYTIILHFIGDHFYITPTDYDSGTMGSLAAVDFNGTGYLDFNPVLYGVALTSAGADVGKCQTYGGWCGDGKIELQYGERCDIKNYVTPSSKETVNIVKNSSFENIFSPWQMTDVSYDLSDNYSFDGRYSLYISTGNFAEASKSFYLEQNNLIYKNSAYNLTLKVKVMAGNLNQISFSLGDQTAMGGWTGSLALTKTEQDLGGWDVYYYNNLIPSDYGYKFRINFTVVPNTAFYLDDIRLVPLDPNVRPQYKCGNDPTSGKICQFSGGYCGDGLTQLNYGETCDDRVGLSCANNEGCGLHGVCDPATHICSSIECNDTCRSTYCGDGTVQRPNSLGFNETCDWGNDPLCSLSCRRIRMGGECNGDKTSSCDPDDPVTGASCRMCESNLSCTIRNFGDTLKKCLGARGSYGCRSNNDCIIGYYCNASTAKCEPEVSTYLRYHPEIETHLELPIPSGSTYDINISKCPDLVPLNIDQDTNYLFDRCTGINWDWLDNISRPNWTYQEAVEDACNGAFRLPTIMELYSLVKQTIELSAQTPIYTDQAALKLCPLTCNYDDNDLLDYCNNACQNIDQNYLYWSSTCTEKQGSQCLKAAAVNFRYGSIEEYPTTDLPETPNINEQAKFKVRCLKDTICGNGKIEEGETCEFYTGADGSKIERQIAKQCSEFGYDGGYMHCDPATCRYRFDNCYFNSRINQSCEQICQGQKALACQSVGVNLNDNKSGVDWLIADDHKLIDIDQNGQCFTKDIPGANVTDWCNYKFMDREKNCLDTLRNQTSPYRSQYSFCNCAE
jgi:hypothetical protein